MSGITPLLDTLLHQVLGKRVDTAPPRDLNEPVRSVAPGEGPRALQSDSRLEGQRPPIAPVTGNLTPGQRESGATPRTDASTSPASTQTHFSPSARTIADVLLRFPAPPSVLSTPSPLMAAGEAASATSIAERLQTSVRDSGLFYESHLARWYRGEVGRQQLERQPQMLNTPRPAPLAPGAGPGTAPPVLTPTAGLHQSGTVLSARAMPLPGQATPGLGQSAGSGQAAHYTNTEALYPGAGRGAPPASAGPRDIAGGELRGEGREAALRESGAAMAQARTVSGEPVHESLQGVVRHQLELLVTPVLRWEGDVWSGVFMALMIHLPAGAQREGEEAGEEDEAEQQEAWHSELQISVPQLGEVHAALWLQKQSVRLQLQSPDMAALDVLRTGAPELEQRLRNAGLEEVLIDVRYREEAVQGGGA